MFCAAAVLAAAATTIQSRMKASSELAEVLSQYQRRPNHHPEHRQHRQRRSHSTGKTLTR